MKEYRSFGAMLNQERLSMGLTLREYCRKNDFDPGKISKIENGFLPVPRGTAFVDKVAKSLGIEKGSEDYKYIKDLATVSRGEIPHDLQSNIGLLPALCRKARMNNLTKKDFQNLVNLITEKNHARNPKKNKQRDRKSS